MVTMLWFGSAILVGLTAPADGASGVARILYLMVPSGWISLASLVAVFLCSAAYLGTAVTLWDHLAHAAGELALLFSVIAAAQVTLLARAASGSWLAVDGRAAMYLVVALVAAVYALARRIPRDPRQGARIAAAVGCGGLLVAGVIWAWFGGLLSVRDVTRPQLEDVPAVSVLWLTSLAILAVFAWLFNLRVVTLEGRSR
jgi:ABC-type transport system involved in cytochrome c biogenesis permease subunit